MSKFGVLVATAIFSAMAFVGSAFAGTITITIDDPNDAAAAVVIAGSDFVGGVSTLGEWSYSVTATSSSGSNSAGLTTVSLDLNSIDAVGSADLIITVTADYSGIGTGVGAASTLITPTIAQDLDYDTWVNGVLVGSVDGLASPSIFSSSAMVNMDGSDFTIVQTFVIYHSAPGQTTSFDATTEVSLPEPGILGFLGFGLLGMGIAARRRRAA